MLTQHQRQPVERNSAAQVMDMMHADIGREPAQYRRKIVMGAAVKRRDRQAPIPVIRPDGMLELVLHVEQPHADRSGDQRDRQMQQQERPHADPPHHAADDERDRAIGRHGADPRRPTFPHQAQGQAVAQDEQIDRANTEHDDGIAVEPISEPAPARQRQIFAHGERVDVADTAAVQIARRGMMDAVGVSPEIIGRQRQHADRATHPVVRRSMTKKRAVAAIVLDHEQADEKTRGRNRQQQIKPVAEMIRQPHRQPQQNERHDRDQNLDDAARVIRFAKARQTTGQGAQIGRRSAGIGFGFVVQKTLSMLMETGR